jgi:hypothetical protein
VVLRVLAWLGADSGPVATACCEKNPGSVTSEFRKPADAFDFFDDLVEAFNWAVGCTSGVPGFAPLFQHSTDGFDFVTDCLQPSMSESI